MKVILKIHPLISTTYLIWDELNKWRKIDGYS
jgi:hypothetical protein